MRWCTSAMGFVHWAQRSPWIDRKNVSAAAAIYVANAHVCVVGQGRRRGHQQAGGGSKRVAGMLDNLQATRHPQIAYEKSSFRMLYSDLSSQALDGRYIEWARSTMHR